MKRDGTGDRATMRPCHAHGDRPSPRLNAGTARTGNAYAVLSSPATATCATSADYRARTPSTTSTRNDGAEPTTGRTCGRSTERATPANATRSRPDHHDPTSRPSPACSPATPTRASGNRSADPLERGGRIRLAARPAAYRHAYLVLACRHVDRLELRRRALAIRTGPAHRADDTTTEATAQGSQGQNATGKFRDPAMSGPRFLGRGSPE